ncbi:restriction endonuclease subunit S, partial [Acinetobacter baumannii]
SDKCQVKEVSVENYISTENMVPNFGGITLASGVPLAGSVTKFSVGDTLFSNIRTYFKKVWQAQFDGYCSNDVLVFRSANEEV